MYGCCVKPLMPARTAAALAQASVADRSACAESCDDDAFTMPGSGNLELGVVGGWRVRTVVGLQRDNGALELVH